MWRTSSSIAMASSMRPAARYSPARRAWTLNLPDAPQNRLPPYRGSAPAASSSTTSARATSPTSCRAVASDSDPWENFLLSLSLNAVFQARTQASTGSFAPGGCSSTSTVRFRGVGSLSLAGLVTFSRVGVESAETLESPSPVICPRWTVWDYARRCSERLEVGASAVACIRRDVVVLAPKTLWRVFGVRPSTTRQRGGPR